MVDIRQDIPYSLRAFYIKELIDKHRKKKKQIAQLYGISPPSIENWLVISRCIKVVQEAIDNNEYPMSAGKIFSTLTKKGQEILYDKLKKYPTVTRDRINSEANRLSDSLFTIPDKERRRDIAGSLIEKKRGHVHKDRTELKVKKMVMDDLAVAEKEFDYFERQVKFYSNTVLEYASVVEIWLRTSDIKNYIESNYPRIFSDICDIISHELGVRV